MIVAKVSVYDDETGKVYAKDKIIAPSKTDYDYDELSTGYMFGFHLRILNSDLDDILKEKEAEFHCGFEESGGHAYNCNDCPNKCEEWYQWDKEFKEKGDEE